jgi:hypothetical protein
MNNGQPQQVRVDLKNAVPKTCACGCGYFIQAVKCYTVSALVSPTGQELPVQVPVLVCLDCRTALSMGNEPK